MGDCPGRSTAMKGAFGARAKRRAVTRVHPEQASKAKLWTSTRPKLGEGSTVSGSSRRTHRDRSAGYRERHAGRATGEIRRGLRADLDSVRWDGGPGGSRTGS